ncbi:hypothetical protein PIB30_000447 [Stylosanthes scabra]|uniref:Uncharacterized protein n=1 Tax=Stylosanthes scabra TaxID=79078 RepID=A0ABU6V0S1_9FABA|nr:hypothetical protein [Stylosanthes scabra]
MAEDELPAFDGNGSGYGWSISAWQFWNSRGTPEAQRLADISRAFSEVCWKEVENWKIEWVEIRAKLLQQPGTTKLQQPEQLFAATSVEIQEKKEIEENANPISTHPFIIDPNSQAEAEAEA